jgi:hypothetical protein
MLPKCLTLAGVLALALAAPAVGQDVVVPAVPPVELPREDGQDDTRDDPGRSRSAGRGGSGGVGGTRNPSRMAPRPRTTPDLNYDYDRGILMTLKVGNNDDNRHTIYGESKGYGLSAYD